MPVNLTPILKMNDSQITLATVQMHKRELKNKITEGKERYTRLKDLLREYKAELTMEWLDSPVALVEIEDEIEYMKVLIRRERELINADVMRWKSWKEEEDRLKGD